MLTHFPSNSSNTITPFALPGRQPVGEESADLKASTFKSLEQSADSAKGENRRSPDEHVNDIGEQERLREGRSQRHEKDPQDREQRQSAEAKAQNIEIEQKQIRELAARDREVRAHEQAHAAVGGKHAGSPVYEFVRGPDGVSYAVGGEVSISTSPVPGDPEATIAKAQQIRRAANAPAEPSAQDRSVSAQAAKMEAEARVELREQRLLESQQKAERQEERTEARQAEEKRKEQEIQAREEMLEQQEQDRAQRADLLTRSSRRNIDINQRLLDIGISNYPTPTRGNLLDRNV